MGGNFSAGRFRFQVENGARLTGLEEELVEEEFDLRLAKSGRLPDLKGAPVASWLMARLTRLTNDGIPCSKGKQGNDGGGYVIEFVTYADKDRPVASFQCQADGIGAAILGDCSDDCEPREVLDTFAAALLQAPTELMECALAVVDPEWKHDPDAYTPRPGHDSCNWYGWDGSKFLGADNIHD
jgi:hypothetical protein